MSKTENEMRYNIHLFVGNDDEDDDDDDNDDDDDDDNNNYHDDDDGCGGGGGGGEKKERLPYCALTTFPVADIPAHTRRQNPPNCTTRAPANDARLRTLCRTGRISSSHDERSSSSPRLPPYSQSVSHLTLKKMDID
jgi:hypothetical protein